jgi:ABC-type multidrug transport system fused ATPase/permease subunit
VRDALFMSVDVVIGVAAYLIGILALAASFDWRLMIPLALWALGYGAACAFFVPRLGRVGSEQADARALMTGRITDAYSNITTVKLFSHAPRSRSRAARDGGVQGDRRRADASRQRVRDRQPPAVDAAAGRLDRPCAVSVAARRGERGRGRGRGRDGAAPVELFTGSCGR